MSNLQVAETILGQIRAMDRMAFFAWGTTDLIGFPGGEKNLGALRWKVRNCRTFKGVAFVKVTLEFDDTYSVKLYKHKNYTKALRAKIHEEEFNPEILENVIDERKDVYVEELIGTIDNMLGEVR